MPVQQHPLPQDISSYKFRLIGDMTVKQFLYIATFIILTILINKSPLPFFFRYPLEALSLGLGIGLAFIPVQGRPLDQWIIAFIKSIYSPTQYVWQQSKEDSLKPVSKKTGRPRSAPPASAIPQTFHTTSASSSSSPSTNHQGSARASAAQSSPAKPQKTRAQHPSISPAQPSSAKPQNPTQTVAPPPQPANTAAVTPSKPSPPKPSSSQKSGAAPSANLPIPFTPDQPNTIVGLTLNPQGLILDGVLIEIISNGLTIRATKSNKLGQFLFAKALENGLYQIKAEKDGFRFATYSITLEGKIVKPLKIQAQA